jgi:6-pyruvoyltetrahydropterin/6-carboxytetrahydropterin synthase
MKYGRYLCASILEMGRIIHITRRERFSAAHKLWIADWSEDQNFAVFGKCANPNWHGHNYDLFVTVKGPVDPKTGFVVDLRFLSDLLKDKVIQFLDHKNINLDTPFMKDKMSSTENIAVAIWDQIESEIKSKGADIHCVKVQETENNYVEFYG